MLERIMGVFKLDVNTFEEIEHDESATGQAALIVAVVAILSAIGSFIGTQAGMAALENLGGQLEGVEIPFAATGISPIGAAISALVGAFVAWLIWAALTYFIGTSLFNAQATMGEMLRVIGFSMAPRMLSVFLFIPCLGAIVAFVGAIWALIAGFIGIRQGLDLDNGKTAVTVILSWLAAVVVNWLVIGPVLGLLL